MMDFLFDILGFFLKVLILVFLVGVPLITLIIAVKKKSGNNAGAASGRGAISIVDLKKTAKKRLKMMQKGLKQADPDLRLKKQAMAAGLLKEEKDKQESEQKQRKSKQGLKDQAQAATKKREDFVKSLEEKRQAGEFCPENLFVIDFNGSTKCSEVKELRRKIDAVLDVATEKDEVVINLTSPGGLVNSYGLCASQLQRIRDRKISLTVTVDEVAASGGYLMACVANRIVAAPFAYIGSIGVIAGIPNFRKVLNKYDVDYEQLTAGKYKRTLSVLGENTEEGRKKFQEELEAVHTRFKEQVLRYRPELDIDKIATGEHWLALDARELGLVDEIATSDEYISRRMQVTEKAALKILWKKQDKKNMLLRHLPLSSLLSWLNRAGDDRNTGALARASREELNELDDNSFLHLK